jgi:Flp pilus assembly protein TadD
LGEAAAGLPQRARVHYNLALLLKSLNRNPEAETALRQALAVEAQNPDYLYALAVLYLEWNRLDEALRVASRLRQYHPDLALAVDLVQYIERAKAAQP